MSNATITDIANDVKMSIATVSRVLNNADYPVKEETKKRILEAADRLGYVPNMFAKGLKTKTSNEIAVIIPLIKNPFYTSFAGGVEGELSNSSYYMSLYTTEYLEMQTDSLVNKLIGSAVAGVIIVSDSMTQHMYNSLYKMNKTRQIPVVTVGHKSDYNELPGLFCDYTMGAKKMIDYLFEKGHQKIAFAFGSMNRETSWAKWVGVQLAYKERGIELDPYYLGAERNDILSGTALAHTIMKSGKGYTAIAAANDVLATGILTGLKEQNISVPDDISVTGYNNSLYAQVCYPPLTTLHIPSWGMGASALKMLTEMLATKIEPKSIFWDTQVIERASVRPI